MNQITLMIASNLLATVTIDMLVDAREHNLTLNDITIRLEQTWIFHQWNMF